MTLIPYDGSPPSIVPKWSDRWEGRLGAELADLACFVGKSLKIDVEYLRRGILRAEFLWPLPGRDDIHLAATYPDTFPFLRPHVVMLDDPKTFPKRHCASDGTLCLLGRDTGLWSGKITLAELLKTNLSKVILGSKDEDPQGEPLEFWWNSASTLRNGSLLLIDSSWNVVDHNEGYAEIEYSWKYQDKRPYICAAISKIWLQKPNGILIAERNFSLLPQIASQRRTTNIKWRRDNSLLPQLGAQSNPDASDRIWHNTRFISEEGASFAISLTLQQSELQLGQFGDSWICAIECKPNITTRHGLSGNKLHSTKVIVPTYRAGLKDLGFRVPAVKLLRESNIALFGLGALGSPLCIDLARNGCQSLTIIDYDIVEPGNTVRWALGASSWGKSKVSALSQYIATEYPDTKIESVELLVGRASQLSDSKNESDIIDGIVAESDIVLDAMASTGVTHLLADSCRRHSKILMSIAGTASLKGGTVTLYHPTSGCPICREWAYEKGLLQRAPGAEDVSELQQPAGCAERTYSGAYYDLQELSLEAMRLTVDFLANREGYGNSVLHTLTLHDGSSRVSPKWQTDSLPLMKECGCQG